MRVGLMVPCYIDMFYPQVGVATVELLEKLGVEVDYPCDQTCCGQPMANSGAYREVKGVSHPSFADAAYAVLLSGPSGSAGIGGITVHPAQGVTTLTVALSPRTTP